jgi:hypothetical protein
VVTGLSLAEEVQWYLDLNTERRGLASTDTFIAKARLERDELANTDGGTTVRDIHEMLMEVVGCRCTRRSRAGSSA